MDPFLHPDMRKGPIPSSRDVEMARDSPYNIIWRYLWTYFFIQICGNGQSFTPQHHLKMSVDPFLHSDMWKLPDFYSTTSFGEICGPISSSRVSPHNIIWKCLRTHFFIQTYGNGQRFIPQHHLEMSVSPFLYPDMWKWLDFNPTTSFYYISIIFTCYYWKFQTCLHVIVGQS